MSNADESGDPIDPREYLVPGSIWLIVPEGRAPADPTEPAAVVYRAYLQADDGDWPAVPVFTDEFAAADYVAAVPVVGCKAAEYATPEEATRVLKGLVQSGVVVALMDPRVGSATYRYYPIREIIRALDRRSQNEG